MSISTIAATRQNEMNASMALEATSTLAEELIPKELEFCCEACIRAAGEQRGHPLLRSRGELSGAGRKAAYRAPVCPARPVRPLRTPPPNAQARPSRRPIVTFRGAPPAH